jgi:hypothetical protein
MNIGGIRVEIGTKRLPNTIPERYISANPLAIASSVADILQLIFGMITGQSPRTYTAVACIITAAIFVSI